MFWFLFFQLFSQFDAEGEGFADVETFLEVLCMSFLLVKQDPFMRMVYCSVNDTGKLGKRKSECSYQELNLRPSDYLSSSDALPGTFFFSTSYMYMQLQETRGS